MARVNCSGLFLLSVVVILLALECSTANCHGGRDRNWLSWSRTMIKEDAKMFEGRKMLQEVDEKPLLISGKNKAADEMLKQNENHESVVENVQNKSIAKEKNESKEFTEAADEVANLMRKDYRGAPRRKPPINNGEPED